jgi:hypothetical protein
MPIRDACPARLVARTRFSVLCFGRPFDLAADWVKPESPKAIERAAADIGCRTIA